LSQGEGGGRPTKYKSAYCKQAKALTKLGATDWDLASFFEVSIDTITEWKLRHPKFSASIKVGKNPSDKRVEQSLYRRATGYSYDAVKIFQVEGKPLIVPYVEHVPPDPTAMIFWLKNRRKDKWRDFKATELSTPPGRPLETRTYAAGGGQLLQDYYDKLKQSAEPAPAPVGPDSAAPRDLGPDGSDGEEPYGDQDVSPR
jgi:hypothetical protein